MTISDLLGQLSQRAEQRRWQEGRLGKPRADGQFDFYAESNDRPGFVMVGFGAGSDTLFVECLNMGVHLIAELPVKAAKNSEGIWEVYPNGLKTQQYLGKLAQVGMSAPHTHEIGGGNPDPVSPRRLTIGLVHTTSPPSMLVQVSPFFYRVGGLEQYFAGGTLDLTAYQPPTANMWAWVKVGVDPATNTLIGEMGTEYSVVTILTDEMLKDIDFIPNIPLVGVRVKNSDTSIGEEIRFSDAHIWITADNASGASGLYQLIQPAGNIVVNPSNGDFDYAFNGDTVTAVIGVDAGNDTALLSGGQRVAVRVVTAAGDVTIANKDYLVCVNKASGAATTVNLPTGITGQSFEIKDMKRDAATNNITLTPASGNIDGAATYVMNINGQSITIRYNGTEWSIV